MQFDKLFSITCTHQYLANQPCNEVIIQPTPVCQRLMQRYGLLFKDEGGGTVSVLHQLPQPGKTAIPPCTSDLHFCLLVSDASFFTYTKTAIQSRENILLYTASKEVVTPLQPTEATKWKLRLPENYQLFGGVSVVPPPTYHQYTISLQTVAVRWQYYVVAEKNKAHYKIDGTTANAAFQQVVDAGRLQNDSTYQAFLQAYPSALIYWFESETALPVLQKARTKIQLINTDTSTTIIDSLPNPPPTANGITVLCL